MPAGQKVFFEAGSTCERNTALEWIFCTASEGAPKTQVAENVETNPVELLV